MKFKPTAVWRNRTSPGPGIGHVDGFPTQDLGAALLMNTNGIGHGESFPIVGRRDAPVCADSTDRSWDSNQDLVSSPAPPE